MITNDASSEKVVRWPGVPHRRNSRWLLEQTCTMKSPHFQMDLLILVLVCVIGLL